VDCSTWLLGDITWCLYVSGVPRAWFSLRYPFVFLLLYAVPVCTVRFFSVPWVRECASVNDLHGGAEGRVCLHCTLR